MDSLEEPNRTYNALGWGLLCVLWGITILFDFVPFAAGLLGTGLILVGANLVRVRHGLPARDDNTLLGLLALSWGALELARPVLAGFSTSTDWAIFAILLVELGALLLAHGLQRPRKTGGGHLG